MPTIRVDGNDVFAVYNATLAARYVQTVKSDNYVLLRFERNIGNVRFGLFSALGSKLGAGKKKKCPLFLPNPAFLGHLGFVSIFSSPLFFFKKKIGVLKNLRF